MNKEIRNAETYTKHKLKICEKLTCNYIISQNITNNQQQTMVTLTRALIFAADMLSELNL
jgi:hypothetical protein